MEAVDQILRMVIQRNSDHVLIQMMYLKILQIYYNYNKYWYLAFYWKIVDSLKLPNMTYPNYHEHKDVGIDKIRAQPVG